MTWRKTKINKKITFLGLIIVVAGVALAALSTSEPVVSFRELPNGVWTPILSQNPANQSVLSPASEPFNMTFWGFGPTPMGSYLELNVGTSGTVRVTVSSVTSQQISSTVFDKVGTRFFEPVTTPGGTFDVRIKNEGAVPVSILSGSNVIVKQRLTSYQVVYPYASWGSLVAVGGIIVLVVGYISKSKKRLPRNKVITRA